MNSRAISTLACLGFLFLFVRPARGVNVPTNDGSAFRTLGLYADRTTSAGVLDHQNVSSYPAYLQSTSLLVTRTPGSIDTVALFSSSPYDHIYFEVNGVQTEAYAEYAVTPPQYATSLGLLVMGVNIYNGSGAFSDLSKPLVRATVTYENADTSVRTLHVGNHIRDYFDSGPISCGISQPLYTARPSDPLSGYIYEDGTYFYDLQEQLLSGEKRNKKVSSVRIEGLVLDHFCSTFVPHIYAGSRLFGLTLWPEFHVENRSNQAVVLQTQNDPAWTDSAYGGYVFNNTYVGFDRTMGALGCFEACVSMAHNYYGVSCTPQALNHWLQANRGFARQPTVVLTSVSGQTVGSTVQFGKLGKNLPKTGTIFLVEHGLYNPIVRIQVTGPGTGQIVQRHQAGTVAMDDIGYIYVHPSHVRAAQVFSGGAWKIDALWGGNTTPADIETALADSLPVIVHTRLTAGGLGRHWVLADGREPAFTSSTAARGTYGIKDPAYGASRLIQSPHGNQFTDARVCRRLQAIPGPPSIIAGAAVTVNQGLQFIFDGAGVIEVTDPLGRKITYDASQDDYASQIPDAIVTRSWIIEDIDNPALDSDPVDFAELPGAIDGSYLVAVSSQATGDHIFQANAYDASGATSTDFISQVSSAGNTDYYRVTYSQSGASVVVIVTDVSPSRSPSGLDLSLSPNPSFGTISVDYALSAAGAVNLSVYDIQGRQVAELVSGERGPGRYVVRWEGRTPAGGVVKAGIYFLRLVQGGRSATKRFVISR